jgi:predicted transcriptional regulator
MPREYPDGPMTLRIKAQFRDRVRELARREGNSEAAVLRRVIADGLDLAERRTAVVAAGRREP